MIIWYWKANQPFPPASAVHIATYKSVGLCVYNNNQFARAVVIIIFFQRNNNQALTTKHHD
jgi:hypothetical protein